MITRLKNIYHFCLAWLGAYIYRHPARELVVVGITGTKGKTTSVELLHATLQAAGIRTALLSSAHVGFGESLRPSTGSNTMPGRFFIQRWLRQAVARGCTHAILEVTSQGVVQHRHRFIDIDIAGLTNLHPEHIESHGSFEAYRGAKVQFFRDVAHRSSKEYKFFFINVGTGGDGQYFEQAVVHPTGQPPLGRTVWYSRENFIRNDLHGNLQTVSSWLRSDFNLENAALVYAIATTLGVAPDAILRVFKDFAGVSGRMEYVIDEAHKKTVVIDAALTPDSLKALYLHLRRERTPGGKLIAVFGSAGGGRDTWKRPVLGSLAAEYCHHTILTTDDPYDEDPKSIAQEIMRGMPQGASVEFVADRAAAIEKAIALAGPKDAVVLTGMGSLAQIYGPRGSKIPWSERRVVEGIFKKLSR